MDDGGAVSNTYCRARQTRLAMKMERSTSGRRLQLAVALEVLDQAPAVDVLEDDAELAVDVLEIEDAADVLVVEDGVAAGLVHEHADVARRRRVWRSCLTTMGRWKPDWPMTTPL